MEVKLKKFQDDFLFSEKRFPALVAGVGTGKTMLLLFKIWNYCLQYPDSMALIVRREYTDLRDCFDDKTDILSNHGWKKFAEITNRDKVLSLNPSTDTVEYKQIKKIIKQDYKGLMYELDTASKSFCVTPNHKLFVGFPTSKNKKKSKTKYGLREVQAIKQKFIYLKRTFHWNGREEEKITIKNNNAGSAKSYEFKMDDWLEFLGWFISEGNTYKHKTKKTWWVSISQYKKVNPLNCEIIKKCLSRMGLPNRIYAGEKFVIGSRAIAEHLNKFCGTGAGNKRIPEYVKNLSIRQLKIFLDAYNKGDGYILTDGTRRFNTISKQLADDVQEIILKTGKSASIHIRDNRGRKTWINDHWVTTRNLDYLIIEHNKKNCGFNISDLRKKFYKGKIYCVEVEPYHTIFVRRNGKCMWSGNSTIKDFESYFHCSLDTNKEYKFQNKSIIMFRHGGELNVLKNINLSIAGIEQADEFETDEQFIFLRDRLRRANAPYRQCCLIANTQGHNWIYRLWKQPHSDVEFYLTEASTFDNADNLPKDFIDDLKKMELQAPSHYNRFVLNSWEDTDTIDNVIRHEWVMEAVEKKLPISPTKRIIVCDVSRYGDDETVIYAMSEKKVLDSQVYFGKSLMETAGNILVMKDKWHANLIAIDSVGVGGGVADRIKEFSAQELQKGTLRVLEINFGEKAVTDKYKNLKAQIWFEAAELFRAGKVCVPNDTVLHEQLTMPRYKIFSDKTIQVESKEEIRKRLNGQSPDRAEAFIMGLYALSKAKSVFVTDEVNYYTNMPAAQNAGIGW